MKRTVVYLILLIVVSGFFAIPAVQAALPLVPCNGPDCRACDLVTMGDRIIKWLVLTMATVIGLIFAWGGVLMVTSAGDTHKVDQARSMMTNSIVGFLILLSAWMIINTIFKVMVPNQQLGVWNEIKCVAPQGKTADPIPQPGGVGTGGVVGSGCTTCVTINTNVASCKPGANCNVTPAYIEKLSTLQADVPITITEGYPPTRTHQNACHTNGTCTDVAFSDRAYTAEKIAEFQADAARAGMRAVFEPGRDFNGGSCTGLANCQPYSVTNASASHFSLYLQ